MAAIRKQCPNCKVTLAQFRWSKLWWMSSMLSGRLVQPCAECGVLLRLSSMTVLTAIASLGFAVSSVTLILTKRPTLLIAALVCAVLILVGALGTRVEPASETFTD